MVQGIRFLKHAIKVGKMRIPVRYSQGPYTSQSGLPREAITIRAKDFESRLPKQLFPRNDSDIRTDYFEKDRARILPGTKFHKRITSLGLKL